MTIRATYQGQTRSIHTLRRDLGISLRVLRRWHEEGTLSEATIDAYLEQRAARWLWLETAESNGLTVAQFYDRLKLGWDIETAATTPVLDRHRRKGCGRKRAA